VVGVGLEDGAGTLTLSADHATHLGDGGEVAAAAGQGNGELGAARVCRGRRGMVI
jgi:hypothetical protein